VRGVGYESKQAPVVERDGAVPEEITRALAVVVRGVPGRGGTYQQRASLLRTFLAETCAELAAARAQVLADRAELDALRGFADRTDRAMRRSA